MSSGAFVDCYVRLAIRTEHDAVCQLCVPGLVRLLLLRRFCHSWRHGSSLERLAVDVESCGVDVVISKL